MYADVGRTRLTLCERRRSWKPRDVERAGCKWWMFRAARLLACCNAMFVHHSRPNGQRLCFVAELIESSQGHWKLLHTSDSEWRICEPLIWMNEWMVLFQATMAHRTVLLLCYFNSVFNRSSRSSQHSSCTEFVSYGHQGLRQDWGQRVQSRRKSIDRLSERWEYWLNVLNFFIVSYVIC